MVTNEVLDFIYNTHSHKITEWNLALPSPTLLQTHADAVNAKGAALNNCFGFIDGTFRPIARPGENQRVVYNGYKRVHALKFQSFVTLHGKTVNKVNARARHVSTLKQKERDSTRWLRVSSLPH